MRIWLIDSLGANTRYPHWEPLWTVCIWKVTQRGRFARTWSYCHNWRYHRWRHIPQSKYAIIELTLQLPTINNNTQGSWLLSYRLFAFQEILSYKTNLRNGWRNTCKLGTARPERDEEDVGFRQLSWMEKTIESFDGQGQKFIIAMLHYLIGIPDTGIDKIINAGYRWHP